MAILKLRAGSIKPFPGFSVDRSSNLSAGLRDVWALAEGAGRNTYNSANPTSYGNMLSTSTGWKSGKGGCAFDGAGVVGGIRTYNAFNLFAGVYASTFTVAARCFPTSISAYQTIYCDAGCNNGLTWHSGKLSWYPKIDATSSTVVQNRWVDIAATYDGNNLRLYIDGIQDSTNSGLMYGLGYYASGIYIGGDNGSDVWTGLIEYVYVWDRALSVSELNQIRVAPYSILTSRQISLPHLAAAAPTRRSQAALLGAGQ